MSTSQAQCITGCMFVHMAWLAESLSTKGEVRVISAVGKGAYCANKRT